MSFSARKTDLICHPRLRLGPGRLPYKYLDLHYRRAPALWLLAVLVLFGVSAPARSEILIESRVGFHGVFQLGRPFPLEIELSNTGGPVEGVLEVQVWKGGATKGGAPARQTAARTVARAPRMSAPSPPMIMRPSLAGMAVLAGQLTRR